MARIADLTTPAELQAAARSRLYQLLGRGFSLPDPAFYEWVREGGFAEESAQDAAGLPYPLPAARDAALGRGLGEAGASHQELQGEYIRLFDVGIPGPPCPLYGGEYQGSRTGVMEELIRFYNYFGLRPSTRSRDLPDHITAELEFMHFLTFQEVTALHQGQDRSPYLRAERDFLERHLCVWVPLLGQRLSRQRPCAFYAAVVALAEAFLAADRRYLEGLLSSSAGPQ
ncbi:MAG: molecular chaperone TorD family protein [Chloroflexota bacterium]|nr:molecular chaperone TorD family protein [Chloroflexota bacterium]